MKEFATHKGRFNKEQSRHINYVIADMVNRAIGPKEISAQTGIPYSIVAGRIYRLRCDGVLPQFKVGQPFFAAKRVLEKNGRIVGNMRSLFERLGADVSEWAVKNTPEESSVADFIASIVRDAYFDETGGSDEGSA